MTVGIVGLGLIGGSFAKAYHEAGETVLAWNRSREVLDFAMLDGGVDGELNEENISQCDLVLVALYPAAAIAYLEGKGCTVTYPDLPDFIAHVQQYYADHPEQTETWNMDLYNEIQALAE